MKVQILRTDIKVLQHRSLPWIGTTSTFDLTGASGRLNFLSVRYNMSSLFQSMTIWGGGVALISAMIGVAIYPFWRRLTNFVMWVFYITMILGIFGMIFSR